MHGLVAPSEACPTREDARALGLSVLLSSLPSRFQDPMTSQNDALAPVDIPSEDAPAVAEAVVRREMRLQDLKSKSPTELTAFAEEVEVVPDRYRSRRCLCRIEPLPDGALLRCPDDDGASRGRWRRTTIGGIQ